jgi:hypothetical protein
MGFKSPSSHQPNLLIFSLSFASPANFFIWFFIPVDASKTAAPNSRLNPIDICPVACLNHDDRGRHVLGDPLRRIAMEEHHGGVAHRVKVPVVDVQHPKRRGTEKGAEIFS